MGTSTDFDAFGDTNSATDGKDGLAPLWVNNGLKDKKKILETFNRVLPVLQERSRRRIETLFNHLHWYSGTVDKIQELSFAVPGRRDVPIPRRITPVFIAHILDLTEQRVSALSRFKPAISVLPNNDEYRDKIRARLVKIILDQVKRQNNYDMLINECDLWNAVFGEIYAFTEWDEKAGPKIDGKPVGDVSIKLKEPWFIFPERRTRWDRVTYVIEMCEVMHVEEIKKRYKVNNLVPDKTTSIYEFEGVDVGSKEPEEMVVYRLWIKPHEFVEKGMLIHLTKGQVLKVEDEYPYEHGDWPWERMTDLDVPSQLHGFSMYNHLVPLQHQYNKLSSLIHRNYTLFAHPKWMMPKGAATIQSLGNAATIVEYSGQRPPELVSFNSTPSEVFGFRDQLREEMQQIYGVHGVSRGAPPPGIRAGIALQFLEEQENQRRNAQIVKHNDFIKRTFKKAASLVGQFYKTDDKRILKVLGKENEYDIRALEDADLTGPWDIELQTTTALSDSKAGKISQIIELRNAFGPELMSTEMAVDMLELGQIQKFFSTITNAIKAAESENEDLLDGRKVSPPERFENHIHHWRVHFNMMQSRSFKEDVPLEYKTKVYQHVKAHEALMQDLAMKNPAFAQEMLTLTGYPAVLQVPSPQAPGPMGPGGGGGTGGGVGNILNSGPSFEGAGAPVPNGSAPTGPPLPTDMPPNSAQELK